MDHAAAWLPCFRQKNSWETPNAKLAIAATAASFLVVALVITGQAIAQNRGWDAPLGEKGAKWGKQCWVGTLYFGYWAACPKPKAPPKAAKRSSTSPRVTGRTPRTAPDFMCVVSTINCATSTDHAQNLAIPRLHTAPRCPAVPLVPLSREVGTLGTKASRPIGRPIAPARYAPAAGSGHSRRHGCLVSGRKIVGRRLMQKLAIAATAASFWGHMGHLPHAVGFFSTPRSKIPRFLRAPLAGGEATPRSSTSPRVTGRTPRTAPDSCASCRRSIAPRRPTTPKISPSHVSIPPRVVPLSRLSRCPARLGHSGQKPHARSDDPLRPRGTLRRQAQDIGPRVCHGCQRRAVPDVQSLRQVSVEWITRRHGCLVSGRKIVGRRLMQKLAIAATAASFLVVALVITGQAIAQNRGWDAPLGEKGAKWGKQCWVGDSYFGYWAACPKPKAPPKAAQSSQKLNPSRSIRTDRNRNTNRRSLTVLTSP